MAKDKQTGKLRPAHGEAETVGVGRLDRAWGWCGVPIPVVLLGELLSAGLVGWVCEQETLGSSKRVWGAKIARQRIGHPTGGPLPPRFGNNLRS